MKLNEMKTTELKEMAKELKVKNWWTLNKATLITEIELLQKPMEIELPELTQMESEAMAAIPEEDFYEQGLDSVLWTDIYLDNSIISSKKLRGVLSSLAQKNLISLYTDTVGRGRNKEEASESTLALTELGKVWMTKYQAGEITVERMTKETKSPSQPKEAKEITSSKSQKNTLESIITLKELTPVNMKGTKARRILREANIQRPYKQWEWDTKEHSEIIKQVKELLK